MSKSLCCTRAVITQRGAAICAAVHHAHNEVAEFLRSKGGHMKSTSKFEGQLIQVCWLVAGGTAVVLAARLLRRVHHLQISTCPSRPCTWLTSPRSCRPPTTTTSRRPRGCSRAACRPTAPTTTRAPRSTWPSTRSGRVQIPSRAIFFLLFRAELTSAGLSRCAGQRGDVRPAHSRRRQRAR